MSKPQIKNIEHPEIIKEILESAPPNVREVLSAYMRAMIELIIEAQQAADLMLEQRNKIMGFVDELIDHLGESFADDKDKLNAQQSMEQLLEKMKLAQTSPKKPEA